LFAPDQKYLWFDQRPSAKRPVRRIFPYRGFLLLPPAALAVGFWLMGRRRLGEDAMDRAAPWQTAFAVILVAVSFGAFSWFSVIAPGARFIMALYLPVLASLLVAAESLGRRLERTGANWSAWLAAGTWLLMFAFVMTHLALIATHPYFDKLKGAF
jgi:hypothetical protein